MIVRFLSTNILFGILCNSFGLVARCGYIFNIIQFVYPLFFDIVLIFLIVLSRFSGVAVLGLIPKQINVLESKVSYSPNVNRAELSSLVLYIQFILIIMLKLDFKWHSRRGFYPQFLTVELVLYFRKRLRYVHVVVQNVLVVIHNVIHVAFLCGAFQAVELFRKGGESYHFRRAL